MDSNQVLAMKTLPKSVVGGGVIGVECQFLIAMGTEVTVIEMLPGLVPV
jgi:pyruvate/2-oxoglutarate dehydrogenase complex dihydrolipoamide dehydrogenase (E3) component